MYLILSATVLDKAKLTEKHTVQHEKRGAKSIEVYFNKSSGKSIIIFFEPTSIPIKALQFL